MNSPGHEAFRPPPDAPAESAIGARPTYRLTRAVFLRGLGVIYLAAFLSLWAQMPGLIGSRGIAPAHELLRGVEAHYGPRGVLAFPTLCWLNDGDGFLHLLCAGGAALAALLVAGLAPVPVLVLLWAFYLSLAVVGVPFFGYQWDYLLLETGFLAIFFAPLGWGPRLASGPGPSRLVLFLLRWLLFRLMLMSAIVKFASGDPTWHALAAMKFHYYTQPLPAWTAWYAARLSDAFQRFSAAGVFVVEGLVPFFYFGPRLLRRIGFWATAIFQGLILATGNFGFFNLLSIVLCVPLLDDRSWAKAGALFRKLFASRRRRLETSEPAGPGRVATPAPPAPAPLRRRLYWPIWITAPLTVVLVALTWLPLEQTFNPGLHEWPAACLAAAARADAFRSANGYGLFAWMTTTRPEIIVEGSDDGRTWKPYGFKWKPGDPTSRPRFCTPHLPRLDWQMWFAALPGNEYRDPGQAWYRRFLRLLLEGNPDVLALLGENPFPARPPKFIRGVLYDYHFTKPGDPGWWRREEMGLYSPPMTLRNGRLYEPD